MTEEDHMLTDRYLRGELPPEEQFAFQERLANDPVLREQVALRQNLNAFVGSDEGELRDLLHTIDAEQVELPAEPSPFSWKWVVGLLLLLLIPLFFLLRDGASTRPAPPEPVTNQPPAILPKTDTSAQTDTFPSSTVIDTPSIAPAAAPPEPKRQSEPAERKPAPQKPKATTPVFAQLDAKDFAPGGSLEDLIGSNLRSSDSSAISWSNFPDTLILADQNPITIFSTAARPYTLMVFTNKEADFINDQPVVREVLESPAYADGYRSIYPITALRKAGLYYVLLFNDDEEILAAERLLVR